MGGWESLVTGVSWLGVYCDRGGGLAWRARVGGGFFEAGCGWRLVPAGVELVVAHSTGQKTQNINAGRVPPPPFMGNRKQGHGGVAVATVAEPVQRSRHEHALTFPLYTHTFHLLGPIRTYT